MLELQGIEVRYGDHVAVDGVDLIAGSGEVVCILGPSGCGKSSMLRAIAGLETPSAGRVLLDGNDITGMRPDRRGIGFAFQDHALFPHRTVAENIGFGLRMQRIDRRAAARRVDEVLALVDLEGFGNRDVAGLSGGERQRVALARAIAPQPRLVMLDEPLGALDRELRDHLLDELPRMFTAIGTTVVYVTHDHEEALSLADRVAVMRAGKLIQVDAPEAVWRTPRTAFVARFLGIEPILDADISGGIAATKLGELAVPDAPDGPSRLALLPGAARLADDTPPPGSLTVEAVVASRRFAVDRVVLTTVTDKGVRVPVAVDHAKPPAVGDHLQLAITPGSIHPLEPDDEPDAAVSGGAVR